MSINLGKEIIIDTGKKAKDPTKTEIEFRKIRNLNIIS